MPFGLIFFFRRFIFTFQKQNPWWLSLCTAKLVLSCITFYENRKPESHDHNAHLNIQLLHNRYISYISVAMTTNQHQAFGQYLHRWKRTTPEAFLLTFRRNICCSNKAINGNFQYSNYKSMETLCSHQIGTKTQFM